MSPEKVLSGLLCLMAGMGCQPHTEPSSGTITDAAHQESSGLVIHNGVVLTLDNHDTVIDQGAVAIADGLIVGVGPQNEIMAAFPNAHRIDAANGLILPGLVNAHTHVPMTLFRGIADDLELVDWLQNHIFPAEAELVDEEFVRWGSRLACLEMLQGGITTFVDMYYFEDVVAEVADACGMRAIVGQTLIDFPAPDNKTWKAAVEYMRRFAGRWRDHPRITPAVAPHAPYTVSAEHLIEAHSLAEALELPLLIHLAEDRSEVEQLVQQTGSTPVEYLRGLGVLTDRMLVAHMVWPTEQEIVWLAEHGVGVAHCPQSNMKVAAGIAPVPAMLDAGVAVGLGTDGAASNNDLSLWEEIDTAAKLHKVETLDPTVVSAREALRMATVEGARALGMANRIGTLEEGKRADLIVVRNDGFHQQPWFDPYSLLVYSTKASDVETVVVDGRLVVAGGEVLTLDSRAITDKAREYRLRVAALEARSSSATER
jgi:5-methylthioadenosine/S-adenosylhomocysteine deaminase